MLVSVSSSFLHHPPSTPSPSCAQCTGLGRRRLCETQSKIQFCGRRTGTPRRSSGPGYSVTWARCWRFLPCLGCGIVYHMSGFSIPRIGPPALNIFRAAGALQNGDSTAGTRNRRHRAVRPSAQVFEAPGAASTTRNNQVDYIGEDVTVRYFNDPPAPTAEADLRLMGR